MPVYAQPTAVPPGGPVTLIYQGGRSHDHIQLQYKAADGSVPMTQDLFNEPPQFQATLPAPSQPGSYTIEIWQDGGYADRTNAFTVVAPAPPPPPPAPAAPAVQANGLPAGASPADYGFAIAATDGHSLSEQTPFVQQVYVTTFGKDAGRHWADQHNTEMGAGGPATSATAPVIVTAPPSATPAALAPSTVGTVGPQGVTGAPGQVGQQGTTGAPGPVGSPLDALGGIGQVLTNPVPVLGIPLWEAAIGGFVAYRLFGSHLGGRRRR